MCSCNQFGFNSFPTRRASDLHCEMWRPIKSCCWIKKMQQYQRLLRRGANPFSKKTKRCAESILKRSEEHTSELQSPCNLVCRLLLEEKKNRSIERSRE